MGERFKMARFRNWPYALYIVLDKTRRRYMQGRFLKA
jgi:hypothetical protein